MIIEPMTASKRSPVPALIGGALLAGALDLAFATGFWHLHGVAASSVLQSIASGVLGNAAYRGGAASATLGLALHFGIAGTMVLAYYLASRRWPLLRQHTLACGLLYGLLLYAIMNGVVLPLSAAQAPPFALDWVAGSILSHCLLVGVPCALATRWATRHA